MQTSTTTQNTEKKIATAEESKGFGSIFKTGTAPSQPSTTSETKPGLFGKYNHIDYLGSAPSTSTSTTFGAQKQEGPLFGQGSLFG